MEFLNAKEQVIDLELTSYGRFMLSQGKFNPKVYAFFDSDILYDNRFAQSGSAAKTKELQNSIEGRIQEGTPRLAVQTLYRGSELGVFSAEPNLIYNLMPGVLADKTNLVINLTQTPDKSYIFQEPIGNSAFNSKNVAAWNIGFYKAPLSGASTVWTGSSGDIPTTFIPQLSCSLQYTLETYDDELKNQSSTDSWKDMGAKSFKDLESKGTVLYDPSTPTEFEEKGYMIYREDFALLKIEEINTEFLKENFELEVFRVEGLTTVVKDKEGNIEYKEDGTAKTNYSETLNRLYFEGDKVQETDRVDYYFDIDYDFEINEEEYCKLAHQVDKIKNIYVDQVFNCEAHKEILHSLNIYETGENQEEEDVC